MRKSLETRVLNIASVLMAIAVSMTLIACNDPMLLSKSLNDPMLFNDDGGLDGLVYYLPKTIVKLDFTSYGKKITYITAAKDYKAKTATTPEVLEQPEVTQKFEAIEYILLAAVTPTEIADRDRAYSLQYDPSMRSNDRVCLGVDNKGLLASVEGAADDKTGDIVVAIAKLAGRLMGPGAFAAAANSSITDAETGKLRDFSLEIDPLNPKHWEQVNSFLDQHYGKAGKRYSFGIQGVKDLMPDGTNAGRCPPNSVCYRTRVPVRFVLTDDQGRVNSSYYKEVVSQRVTGRVDVSRALMVEKITKLSFTNGVLSGVNIRKPSEGLAVAKLPLTVIDAITTSALAAPGDFLAKATGNTKAYSDSLKQAAANETDIKTINEKLREIRTGDYDASTLEDPAAAKTLWALKCTPGKS
jgi:hypothetical protein